MTLYEELSWRGFVNQTTIKDTNLLNRKGLKFYFGVDPSADSMTVGNLAAAMMVGHFMHYGHEAILLVGGATGMIGDPDGKATERELLSLEQLERNKKGIAEQYKRVYAGRDFTIVDNYDWFRNMNYLDFLRDIGKHVPMRQMLGREFIQSRLGEDGNGISYAEFSYSLIQGYDFLHLHREFGVTLQLCGADQWGNSIAGVELIRRITGHEAHVWTNPLIINKSTGVKFGKSEAGAVWLDEQKTSVYAFYQFWINLDDETATELLSIYTWLNKEEIDVLKAEHSARPELRVAQKTLAYEVTKIVHGELKAHRAVKMSQELFSNTYQDWTADDFEAIRNDVPYAELKDGTNYIDALIETGLASSKTDARRLIEGNAILCFDRAINIPVTVTGTLTCAENKTAGSYRILVKGKKHKALVKLVRT